MTKGNFISSDFIDKIHQVRLSYKCRLPRVTDARVLIDDVLALLFPHFASKRAPAREAIEHEIVSLKESLRAMLRSIVCNNDKQADDAVAHFISHLPVLHDTLWLDAEALMLGDPAAASIDEIILAYPGFYAIAVYRIAHEFYKAKIVTFPRLLTECAHQLTGIDIHPGATIGKHFFIDHGTGVVIGETTVIHDHVKIYQGVTLGALSVAKTLANQKRHPTIEDNVVIYSNATILGGETVIGKNSIIGGNVWVTSSVPPESVVYHKSDIKVKSSRDIQTD